MRWLIICCIALISSASATRISVYEAGYPQYRDDNIRVEDVVEVVHDRGAYIEHQVHVTFAYDFDSWFFKNYSELELEWSFQMPEEVTVYNLYFWKGDSVIRAMLLDKWTAEQLFNEKSSPVREPALLTRSFPDRNGMASFSMRLFPMRRFEKKRIMIQYLVPARASSGRLRTWLPLPQLTTANGGANSLRLLYFHHQKPDSVQLIGLENVPFQYYSRDQVWETTFDIKYGDFAELIIPSPIQNDFFLSTYTEGDETFYQLSVYPPLRSADNLPRKILVLVDYNPSNSSGLSSELLLGSLKETMERSLSSSDSVAIIVSFSRPLAGSTRWLGCTQTNLDHLFNAFWGNVFLNVNLSQDLLVAGNEFLHKNGVGEVLWICNRADFPTGNEQARAYAQEIAALFPPNTILHVIDLENIYSMTYYPDYGYGNVSFTFLSELTRVTGGNLFFYRYHPLKTALAALFFDKVVHYKEIEIQTRMQSGYTFDREQHAPFEGYYPLDFPVIQTGRLQGVFPMSVSVIASTLQSTVRKEFIIPAEAVTPGTAHLRTAFYGHQVEKMSHRYQDNWLIGEIISTSMKGGVLSPYTAFLVPDDLTPYYVPEFVDETRMGSTPVEPHYCLQDSLIRFAAAPNPFNPLTTFYIDIPAKPSTGEIVLEIYNLAGQRIREWIKSAPSPGRYSIGWSGSSDSGLPVASGTYVAVLHAGKQIKTLRVTLLK
jgi:hypothetical protein